MVKQAADSKEKSRTRKPRKSLSKTDIVVTLANSAGITRLAAKKVLDDVVGVMSASITNGVSVRFHGLGVFYPHKAPPRRGRNPRTGESVDIPPRKSMKFRATKELRDLA